MTTEHHVPLHFTGSSFDHVDLLSIAEELLNSDLVSRDGRTARTLAKSKGLTVVLEALRKGGELREHAASGPVTIIPLLGSPTFFKPGGDEGISVDVGAALFIPPGERHSVSAAEDTAFLIVIGAQEEHG